MPAPPPPPCPLLQDVCPFFLVMLFHRLEICRLVVLVMLFPLLLIVLVWWTVPTTPSKCSQGCQMITGVILWQPVFAEFLSICAHLCLYVPFVSEMAQMAWHVLECLSKIPKGGQRFAGFNHWHPWSIFAEYWPICAWLCLSVPFVSEMAQMDCQVPKSPYKCSQRCQRISRVILWHPWLHRNWWNLSILTHLCQIKLICAICVWHLCHLRMTGVILLPTFAKYLCLFTLEI